METTNISKRESQVINEIEERDMIFFSPRDVCRFLGIEKRNAYNLLSRMKEKDLVKSIESGRYILREHLNSKDVYELASNIVDTSYLGFMSALHFHDMIDQVPRTIQIASTKRKKPLEIQGTKIKFVKIREKDFFGYEDYDGTVASDPEKTVIDSLRLPGKAGDVSKIAELDFKQLDQRKLIRYSERTESSATASRLGYIMEKKNIGFDTERVQNLIRHYSRLDPTNEQKDPISKWKLYANRETS